MDNDDLSRVRQLHVAERPASDETMAAARRRLLREASHPGRAAPLPRSRRMTALVAAATVCVLIGVSWTGYKWHTRPLYQPEPLAGQSGPASTFLLAAADAQQRRASDGRLWHVHQIVGQTVLASSRLHQGVRYSVQIRQDKYSLSAKSPKEFGPLPPSRPKGMAGADWTGGDIEVRPVTPTDKAAWTADGQPGARDLGLGPPTRGLLKGEGAELDFTLQNGLDLPADPSKLRAWILNYATKFDHQRLRNPDLYLFNTAPIILVDRVVTDRVRIAAYRMLASLKDVRMITSTDADGRVGKAVAMRQRTPDNGTIEWQLFIDPATGRLTASQGIVVTPGPKNAALAAGTRQYFEIVKTAEWSNAPRNSLLPRFIWDPNWEPPLD